MKISEIIRYVPFKIYLILVKSQIRSMLKIRHKNFSEKEWKTYINNLDKNIKNHAIRTTNFYRKQQFPIINKQFIQENKKEFLSHEYSKDDLDKVSTSGSYGTPTTFYRNKIKKTNQIVDVLFYGHFNNYFFGIKHAFIRGISKSKLKLFIQNEIHLSPNNLSDLNLKNYYNQLKKVNYIIGFPSVLLTFIEYCKKNNFEHLTHIQGVLCSAEALSLTDRDIISEFFQCEVVTRYASEEIGIIANRLGNEDFYRINNHSVDLKIYKFNSNELEKNGEEGRIIVTDYYSHAMPLINYDTGDLGIINEILIDGRKTRVLKEISGRMVEQLYDENDEVVSPFGINVFMKEFQNIGQFQFIQQNQAEYKVLITKEISEKYKNQIIDGLKSILGLNTEIKIEKVDVIPSMSSGKRPYILNNYNRDGL